MKWFGLGTLILALAIAWISPAVAAVPALAAIEGALTGVGGAPVADGNYNMTFSLYPSVSQGTAAYVEGPVAVAVKGGAFSWILGSAEPIKIAALGATPSVWIGIKIETEPELPRKQLVSAPFAMRTALAEGMDCTGCVTTSQLAAEVLAPYAKSASLAKAALSGSYLDLKNLPDLSIFAVLSALAKVATSGNYADLIGAPTLATVATTGKYSDLLGAPALSAVGTSGKYADLTGQPALANVATSGKYADLNGIPNAAKVGTACGSGLLVIGLAADGSLQCTSSAIVSSPWISSGSSLGYASGGVGIGTLTPNAGAVLELNSTTQGFLPPRMTTAQRNAIAAPPAGTVVYNTTTRCLDFYDGSLWGSTCAGNTGGVISEAGGYRVHTFQTDGVFTVLAPGVVDVLVVAGGGSGGTSQNSLGGGGGGGAGGLIYQTSYAVKVGTYPVTVGAGGAAVAAVSTRGNNGGNSLFGSALVAVGGGGGGNGSGGADSGAVGGSGGGAGYHGYALQVGAAGTAGQGNAGGSTLSNNNGGGGGGAGGQGGNTDSGGPSGQGGQGGPGLANAISGATVTYARGGDGGSPPGGFGNGSVHTGEGGTGVYAAGGSGAGGSGIVIVRYLH